MPQIKPSDILYYAGGEVLERYGVLIRRSSPAEEVPLIVTGAAGRSFTDRDGTAGAVEENQARVSWIDRDGDGDRESAMLATDSADFVRSNFPYRVMGMTLWGDFQIVSVGASPDTLAQISSDAGANRLEVYLETAADLLYVAASVGGVAIPAVAASAAGLAAGVRLRWMARFDPAAGSIRAWARVDDGAVDESAESTAAVTYTGAEQWDSPLLALASTEADADHTDALIRAIKVARGATWTFAQMEAAGR